MTGVMISCATVKPVPYPTFTKQIRRYLVMETQPQNRPKNKVYVHYNHTDSCKSVRWTARESYQFMYERPWQDVADFYHNVVKGRLSLLDLFGSEKRCIHDNSEISEVSDTIEEGKESCKIEDRSGRWARVTFKIVVSYNGASFDGWQKQPGLNSVQGLVENSLASFVDEKKAQLLKEKGKPLEGCATVAGRTDKGVSAIQQVCSFYTWRTDVKPHDIENSINSAAPGEIRTVSVSKVSRDFHPNFSAKWRRYLYIFPLYNGQNWEQSSDGGEIKKFDFDEDCHRQNEHGDGFDHLRIDDKGELESGKKPRRFTVTRVNLLLQQLEGKLLSYKTFARDTKASRSSGPPTECFIYHARASEARLPCSDHNDGGKVMCVELVANRFLRRMVRVLVATSMREAAAGADDDALLKLMEATCRRATAPPAPPDGLSLVDVGYSEFDPRNSLIP